MCAAKSEKKTPSRLKRLVAWLVGTGRPVVYLLLIAGVFGGGSYLAWHKMRPRILDAPEYRLGPGQVNVSPPTPAWIHSDILAEAFRDPRLDGALSIMDDDLVDRIRKVFEDHPWVERVVRVQRRHPASVDVELEYRRPVCMVQVPKGVLAVDPKGVVLPSGDFTPYEATRYPLIVGVDRKPSTPVGRTWRDAKVIGGAEIAAAFGPAWDVLKLHRIVPMPNAPSGAGVGPSSEPFFALTTRKGTQILWGYAPGANVLGEIPAQTKVDRLKQYQLDNDTLDDPRNERRELDVRTMGQATAGH